MLEVSNSMPSTAQLKLGAKSVTGFALLMQCLMQYVHV